MLCGGCALNSSANGKLLEPTGFRELFVPSAPADDGNAVGAALLAFFEDDPSARPSPTVQSPYLGSRVARDALERAAEVSGFRRVQRLDEGGRCELVRNGFTPETWSGGCRAQPSSAHVRRQPLDPRRSERPHVKDRINALVKFREEFRPFAPAILAEYGPAYFHDYQDSPYMERTLVWRDEVRDRVAGVVHVDGTGRLQSVKREWNPLFHRLLSAFHQRSGIPVLLDTSFNVMGKPIVHTVEDAFAVFVTSGLDLLVIEDYLFAKRD